ncbi:MAG: hypothetical protein SWO11_06860 [Thermodesulfobacteriota bacterium]|nr:hypothetical protein [Thermodesulfobacteriota bacterium]
MAEKEEGMKQEISAARVFIDRYIKGLSKGTDDLDRYISKYKKAKRTIIARVIFSRLIEKIDLKNYKRLLKGLHSLEGYFDRYEIKEIEDKIGDICDEYERKKEEQYVVLQRELEELLTERLKQRGISGSAVEVNIKISSQWSSILDQIDSQYNRLLCFVKRGFVE